MPSGAASRMTGFMAHLRHNGFAVGPGETELVLSALAANEFPDVSAARLGLKTMLSGDRVQWSRFDELFDAYWFKRGLRRLRVCLQRRIPHRPPLAAWKIDGRLGHGRRPIFFRTPFV